VLLRCLSAASLVLPRQSGAQVRSQASRLLTESSVGLSAQAPKLTPELLSGLPAAADSGAAAAAPQDGAAAAAAPQGGAYESRADYNAYMLCRLADVGIVEASPCVPMPCCRLPALHLLV